MMYGAWRIYPRQFLASLLFLCVVAEISCSVYWCFGCPKPCYPQKPMKPCINTDIYKHTRKDTLHPYQLKRSPSASRLLWSYSWIRDCRLTNRRNRERLAFNSQINKNLRNVCCNEGCSGTWKIVLQWNINIVVSMILNHREIIRISEKIDLIINHEDKILFLYVMDSKTMYNIHDRKNIHILT